MAPIGCGHATGAPRPAKRLEMEGMMRRILIGPLLLGPLLLGPLLLGPLLPGPLLPGLAAAPAAQAQAPPAEAARRLYARFVAAQNAHDFDAVRATLLDSRHFLWVTNGLSLWGPEAALARLRAFHANEVWRIDPAWDRAEAVETTPDTVLLHVPLVLTVGPRAAPARYRILISALCVRTADAGWRIAALLTTDENPEGAR